MTKPLEAEYEEIRDLRLALQSDAFQRHIVKPLGDYSKKQKNDFFSDTLKASWRKGGRVEAVREFFSLLKKINEEETRLYKEIEDSRGA